MAPARSHWLLLLLPLSPSRRFLHAPACGSLPTETSCAAARLIIHPPVEPGALADAFIDGSRRRDSMRRFLDQNPTPRPLFDHLAGASARSRWGSRTRAPETASWLSVCRIRTLAAKLREDGSLGGPRPKQGAIPQTPRPKGSLLDCSLLPPASDGTVRFLSPATISPRQMSESPLAGRRSDGRPGLGRFLPAIMSARSSRIGLWQRPPGCRSIRSWIGALGIGLSGELEIV